MDVSHETNRHILKEREGAALKPYQDMRLFGFAHHGDPALIQEELEKRYHSEAAIHLPFCVGDAPAFVMLNGELHQLISSIHRWDKALMRLCGQIPSEAMTQFANSTMVEEIQQTNEVENVQSTRKEIREAFAALESNQKGKRFSGMVNKYHLLIAHRQIPLQSCQDIRDLYDDFILDEVLRENRENAPDGLIFRKGPIGVYSNRDQKIHAGLFPESRIIEAMEQGLTLLHDPEIDPLIRIAAYHYWFAYVHPFYDGNGRMTRFISSYMLSQEFSEAACLRIAYVIKDHRRDYYRLFRDANEKRSMGDLTRFVIGFLRFFEQALMDAHTSLDEKNHHYQQCAAVLSNELQKRLPDLDLRYHKLLTVMLQEDLFGHPRSDIHKLAGLCDCNERTLRNVLKQCGDLVCHETEKKKFYWHINLSVLDGQQPSP